MSQWEKPPPKLVRKKKKFPIRIYFLIVILIYIVGVITTWVVVGRWMPLEDILFSWLILTLFVAIIILSLLLLALRYS
jgi:hypothetical protein